MPSSGDLRKELLRETRDSKLQTIRGKHRYLRTKPKQFLPQDERGRGGTRLLVWYVSKTR